MRDFFYNELNKELEINANLDKNSGIVSGTLTNNETTQITGNLTESQDVNTCIYGKLNNLVELQEYKGWKSDTIEIVVDNKYHIIKANLLVSNFASKEYVNEAINTLRKYTDEQLSNITIDIDALTLNINKTNERIDNVKIDLSNLDQKLQDEITHRTEDVNNLNSLISTETTERKQADEDLSSNIKSLKDNLNEVIQGLSKEISDRTNADNELSQSISSETETRLSKDNELEQKIDDETTNRTSSDETLQANINTEIEDRKQAIISLSNNLTGKINQEIADRTIADNELQSNINNLSNTKLDASNADRNVLNEISFNTTGDNVYLKKDYINLKTLNTSNNQHQLELATDTQAGLMSMSDYQTLYNLKDRVSDLEGKTSRLLYTEKTNPTADDINAFVTNLGYTVPFSGVAVVVDKTFHIWHYYENDNIGWQDDGLDTVNTFTNTNAGIIKGAEVDGKVYAETDGTGSVYGWGSLKGRVITNESNISSLQTDLQLEIQNREDADNTLTTNLNNEISARQLKDTELENKITANTTTINTEIENRTLADTSLQEQITTNKNNITTNTQSITTINNTLNTYGDIVTHNVNEFATATQGTKADSALQPKDNITELTNNAGYTKVEKSTTNGNIKIDDVETTVYNDNALQTSITNLQTSILNLQTSKQDKLISGTNIKTLNNESLLGSGNIDITSAQWGNITGDLNDQTDLKTELDSKYVKPTYGIPKTDLTSDVQESLRKADNALPNTTQYVYDVDLDSINTPLKYSGPRLMSYYMEDGESKSKEIFYIEDELTSTSNRNPLSANQGRILNNKITTNSTNISTINSKIPTQATSTNQLADKDFVNSSINNAAAFYITKDAKGSAFESYNELITTITYYSGGVVRVPARNDYCIVRVDENNNDATTRYYYQNNQWEFQYVVSDKPLTSDQLKAINSGITSELVTKLQGIEDGAQVNTITSVNNKTGAVNLTYNDVGALSSTIDYLKSATVSNDILTITKQDDSSIEFEGGKVTLRRWS